MPTYRALAPVHVEPRLVRRIVVGLRPFRPDGFRVSAERVGSRLLVHNYGHGGSGITLSWGTARQAAALALSAHVEEVAILGCGVAGLTTARVLQEHGVRVTIHASALPPDTTSNVPAAFFLPVAVCDPDRLAAPFAHQLADALRYSRRVFDTLSAQPRYGVRALPMYVLDGNPPQLSPFMAVAPELFLGERFAPGEHPFGERHALVVNGLVVDTSLYIGALLADVRAAGGEVVVHTLHDTSALVALPQPVIVNCTGLGAAALAEDRTLEPLKGQLLLLDPQPEVDYIVVAPQEGLYMVPRADAIVLGTSKERGARSLEPNTAESARILEGHARLFDSRGS